MEEKRLFISWSGEHGCELAEGLAKLFRVFAVLRPWTSSTSIESGQRWFDEIEKALQKTEFGLACLSPGASRRPWVNFEVGFLVARLQKCLLVQIGSEAVCAPLAHMQVVRGNDRPRMEALLASMIGDKDEAERVFDMNWHAWMQLYERSATRKPGLLEHADAIFDLSQRLESSVALQNSCFRAVLEESLRRTREHMDEIGGGDAARSFKTSAVLYPQYLIQLQRHSDVIVSAIAMIDEDEHFWRERLGKEILHTSHSESRRVFIVRNETQLTNYLDAIKQHAARYRVAVMDRAVLLRRFSDYVKDFSLLCRNGSYVLAAYAEIRGQETIRFSYREDEIREHLRSFEEIWAAALPVNSTASAEGLWTSLTRLTTKDAPLSTFPLKQVEMSAYIPVHAYDEHEIKHAYFVEMMDCMLRLIEERQSTAGRSLRILELGAGTGIFTRRLAERLPTAEIVAIEVDWACYQRLTGHVHRFPNVQALNQDSRLYDAEGKFDVIASSFSDHHIRVADKHVYLANVMANLTTEGELIVGDEYLGPHVEHDGEQRVAALQTYHGHIIDLARQEGHHELAHLEQQALDSGLNKVGDFKVSCREYESLLTQCGFSFESIKIGPLDPKLAHVGGVYVYRAWRRARASQSTAH